MKIAQISTYDIDGGAARARYRLHRGMLSLGHDSRLLVLARTSGDDTVGQVPLGQAADEFPSRCLRAIQRHYIDAHRTAVSNTRFTLPYPGYDLSVLEDVRAAHVINLHWVALLQSPSTLLKLLRLGAPVVWTLHDMWALTGGCHYSAGCRRYEEQCFPCPQLGRDPFRLPAAVLDDRVRAITEVSPVVVAPSQWLASCARRSRVFRDARIEVIPNSLDTTVFAPLAKDEARRRLGLGADTLTVLAGAEDGRERRKGFAQLADALARCTRDPLIRTRARDNGGLALLWFGRAPDGLDRLPVPVVSLGRIASDEKLREIYAAADVYVLPSLEDNLPNTLLEAMSCGVAVVAFRTGGIPELVSDGVTGRLAEAGDVDGLAQAVLDCLRDRTASVAMGQAGRRAAEARHEMASQAQAYLDLYRELLRARPRSANGSRPGPAAAPAPHSAPLQGANGLVAPLTADLGPGLERIVPQAALPALHLEIDDLETRLAEANAAVDQLRAAMSTAQESHREERAMRDVFEARVSAMESSKFWKLRTVWFRLKRALRLTSGG